MGCSACIPFSKPLWYSYFGPIYNSDAIAAINSSSNELHLQDQQHSRQIPMHKVKVQEMQVPVALYPNASEIFEENSKSYVIIKYAATCEGTLTMQCESKFEKQNFSASKEQEHKFELPNESEIILKFDFENWNDITCRIYSMEVDMAAKEFRIKDDKIIKNGVVLTISKVYRQLSDEENESGMCIICCEQKACVVNFPCRHCCMCHECAEKFSDISVRCPICRTVANELIEFDDNK